MDQFAPWPEPEPIDDGLPSVQRFDERLLPASFRDWVADITDRMQVPADYPAAAAVLCLAGAVNRRATIQPKAEDSSWIVVPNLWGGIIADPGLLKSPVIHAVKRPLQKIQEQWWQEHGQAEADYGREKEEYELRHAAWRDQYKAACKTKRGSGSGAGSWTEVEPSAPSPRRIIVNDATFEALHEILRENPAGVLVVRDELTGWWSQLDRQGREGERAFYLQAWNGDTAQTIDRIGRGSINVPNCCVSMLGGIQPARLRSYLIDAVTDGPMNDGLIQRFQVLVWPDTPKGWRYVDRPANSTAENAVRSVFDRLVKLDVENPLRLRFSDDAQSLFVVWLSELESRVRGNELHAALVSHLSKYRSLMPTLAALFELADAGTSEVSLEHAKQAAAWCAYLESHARRIYSCVVTPQIRAARDLAEKIKTRKIGAEGIFSCRDVYLKGWSGLDAPESVKRAVEVLQDAGWVREIPSDVGTPGRPSNRYAVNPAVR
jgi:putative DNA primase/helicase